MTDRARGIARIALTVRGAVQGVGYRWFVVHEASLLGLVGWVANAPDGSVRLEAEGPPDALEQLVHLVEDGPPGAVVEGVSTSTMEALRSEGHFTVRSFAHVGD